jgi:NAD+ kinase
MNDAVITKSALSRMLSLKIKVSGQELFARFRGDGFIVASALGSTAYGLSAGGPILHPALKNLSLTPVCPQTLAHRSVILSGEETVSLEVLEGGGSAYLTDDGQEGVEIAPGTRVEVSRAQKPLKFLVPTEMAPGYADYFPVLREKLGFGGI